MGGLRDQAPRQAATGRTIRALVIGNCAVDRTFHVSRLPRPGETVLASECDEGLGGKGANQAAVLRRAGLSVTLVAAVGEDDDGRRIKAWLEMDALAERLLVVAAPSDRSVIMVEPGGENTIVSTHEAARAISVDRCHPAIEGVSPQDIVLLQGNLSAETTMFCLKRAHEQGANTVLNAAPIQFDYDPLWRHVGLAVVNTVEACVLGRSDDPIAGARAILSRGVPLVAVTLGAAGAALLSDDDDVHAPALKVPAVDTSGAGDTFCAALAAALLAHRLDPRQALRVAVDAACLVVTRRGTMAALPTRAELATLFDSARIT
jgi:ribokinase